MNDQFCDKGLLQVCSVTGKPIMGTEELSIIKDYPGERWCWWQCPHCGGWHLCSCGFNSYEKEGTRNELSDTPAD